MGKAQQSRCKIQELSLGAAVHGTGLYDPARVKGISLVCITQYSVRSL